jgi:hypothetical protein
MISKSGYCFMCRLRSTDGPAVSHEARLLRPCDAPGAPLMEGTLPPTIPPSHHSTHQISTALPSGRQPAKPPRMPRNSPSQNTVIPQRNRRWYQLRRPERPGSPSRLLVRTSPVGPIRYHKMVLLLGAVSTLTARCCEDILITTQPRGPLTGSYCSERGRVLAQGGTGWFRNNTAGTTNACNKPNALHDPQHILRNRN